MSGLIPRAELSLGIARVLKEVMLRTSLHKRIAPIIIASMLLMIFGFVAQAAAPSNFVTYQGRLLNSNGVPVSDASLSMKFFLYSALTGGTCLWSNSSADCDSNTPASTTARTVTLTTGLFTQNLGDTGDSFAAIGDTVFGDNTSVFLEVDIAGETLTPRRQMTAAPYAINSQLLDGISSAGFLSATGDTGTGDYDLTGAELLGTSALVFEGSSNDSTTTTFAITNPTSNRTITFQNGTGTVAFTSDISGTGLWEDGANGVFEDDEAVIIGANATFSYASGGVGDLRVNDELEVLSDAFIDNDLVVGASTSSTETLAHTSFSLGGDDLFVAGTAGIEGVIYTDGGLTAGTDTTFNSGAITTTGSTDLALTIAGGDLTFAQDTVIGDGADVLSINSSDWDISTTGAMTGIGAITMDGNFSQTGATTFGTGTGAVSINGESTFATDANFSLATTENVSIVNTNATADVLVRTVTAAGNNADRINFTLADDGDVDTVSALSIAVTSAATSDADVLQGIHINNLSSADVNVVERALTIGSGWDTNLLFADTSSVIDITDTGVFTFRDGTNTLMTLTDGGTTGNLAISGTLTVTGAASFDGNANPANAGVETLGTTTLEWDGLYVGDDGVGVTFGADQDASLSYISGSTSVNLALDDSNTFNIDGDGSPTADLVQIGSGDTSVTDGVDALQLTFGVSAASGSVIDITPAYTDATAGGTSETYNIIDIDSFTATQDATGDTGLISALSIGNLTQTETNGTITAVGLDIGTGWDAGIEFADATAIMRVADGSTLTIEDTSGNDLLVLSDVSGSTDHVFTVDSNTALALDSSSDDDIDIQTVSNEMLRIRASGTGDVIFEVDADSQVQVSSSVAPEVDMLLISNSANPTTSDGVNALSISHSVSNAGAHAVEITPAFAGGATDTLAYSVISIEAFTPSNAAGTDTVNGVSLGNLTDPGATITSRGFVIGTGWDRELEFSTGEYFGQPSDDNLRMTGTGGTNNTDVNFNLDNAAGPIISSNADTNIQIDEQLTIDLASGGAGPAVCHTGADADVDNVTLEDCSGAPTSDYAEQYPAADNVEYGHIVVPGTKEIHTFDESHGSQTIREVVLSSKPYQGPIIGIVSNNYGDFTSAGYNIEEDDNPMPVALVGRVPVKVTGEGGSIAVGDYLTTSSTPGHAMKATKVGRVLGMALNNWDGISETVMVQVHNSWYAGQVIGHDGTSTVVTDNVVVSQIDDATSSETTFDSYGLSLRGSAWDGSEAEAVEMMLQTLVNDVDEYRLSINNTSGTEVAYITNEGTMRIAGDMVISGRLYPSDRGTAQTSKYIYYDGSAGVAGGFMRTNAKGWSTGSYDFAEMFPSDEELKAGDIVMFAGEGEKVVRADEDAVTLAGIVSTRPGFLAGENKENSYPIALAGRVPTKVSLEGGDILVGDPLTSSSEIGVAMKAKDAGAIVGYALEPYSGEGDEKTLVYVNVGYWGGRASVLAPGSDNQASGFASSSTQNFTALNLTGSIAMNSHSISNIGSLSGMGDSWTIESNGTITTEALFKTVIDSYQNTKVETVAVTSPEVIITLSGTSTLVGGSREIRFENVAPDFNDVINVEQPIRVVVTPSGPVSLYVSEKDQNHFTVKRFTGEADVEFDWMVTAYRRGYEAVEIEEEEGREGSEGEESVEDEAIIETVEDDTTTSPVIARSPSEVDDEAISEDLDDPVEEVIEEESVDEVIETQTDPVETEDTASLESPELTEVDSTSEDDGGELAEEPAELDIE
jgi:hypothetical protein